MQPIPPAFDTAAANGPPEVLAMPASMIGCLIPRILQRGVVIYGEDILGKSMVSYVRSVAIDMRYKVQL